MQKQIFSLSLIFILVIFSSSIFAGNKIKAEVKTQIKPERFKASLNGNENVPPINTKASGEAIFTFSKDGKKLFYRLIVHNIDKVIMAHIHHAPAGKDGPIAAWLYKGKVSGKVNGLLAKGTITNKDVNLDSLKTWINNSEAYVLVHTKKYPNGEIRGIIKQIK
jgi:hypothetical protein